MLDEIQDSNLNPEEYQILTAEKCWINFRVQIWTLLHLIHHAA